jgi:hypothetical protein
VYIKPVETVPEPGYPDKYAAEARQALVQAHPSRWLRKPLIVGVLSASVALGLSGCDDYRIGGPFTTGGAPTLMPTETGTDDIALGEDFITMGEPAPLPALNEFFVPLFEYGEGTGSYGCMSVTAPVFMSEEEAFAILAATFAEAGLTLDKADTTLVGATLPVTDIYSDRDKDHSATTQGGLIINGLLNIEQGLPVKFVSTDDVTAWHKDTGMYCTVSYYRVREAARTLAGNNRELVVFYDPIAMPGIEELWSFWQEEGESDEDYWVRREIAHADYKQAAKAESEQHLREQAEAFVDWLHGEGVL